MRVWFAWVAAIGCAAPRAAVPLASPPARAPSACTASERYPVQVLPEVADGTCTSAVRRLAGPEGRVLDVASASPDGCGPAMLVATLANCTDRPVRLGDVRVEVRGRTPDASGYTLAETDVLPGAVARVPVRTRGVGDLTVTFDVEHDGRHEHVAGHARVRRTVTTTYE